MHAESSILIANTPSSNNIRKSLVQINTKLAFVSKQGLRILAPLKPPCMIMIQNLIATKN